MAEQAGQHSPERFPKRLHRYQRQCFLGGGGGGKVYRYYDPLLHRSVAVKSLADRHIGDPEWRRRVRREARALARVRHANIAQIYDVVTSADLDYLVMEYVSGCTLDDELKAGPWPIDKSLRVCLQVAEAIEAGHEEGFIHRDVKPANIMVTAGDVAVLLDLGLAKFRDAETTTVSPDAETGPLPRAHVLDERGWGTPGYMSPEQAAGQDIDERTDIWAFGCVLFECLAGTAAFPGSTAEERVRRAASEDPPWDRLPASLPAPVTQLLRSCLQKAPGQRLREIAYACSEIRSALCSPAFSPAAGTPVSNNLPATLTGFVGRSGEVEDLVRRLADHRLVVVTGPGGVGKTRLALECARRIAGGTPGATMVAVPDGVWLVDVAPGGDSDAVAQTIATTLVREGVITLSADRSVTRDLIDGLRAKVLLLILDNCDRVTTASAALLDDLLAACPQLRVIATSRQALGTGGGQLVEVVGLSFPAAREHADPGRHDAIRLFVQRAALARPGFALTERNARAVADVCRQLHGIPLAIELAASRLRAFDVEELAARLFDVLDPVEVLESSIGWSFDQLTDVEQTLLCRLSVFQDGWTIAAAEQICGDGGSGAVRRQPVIRLLGSLVDHSIVAWRTDGEGRRYYLLDTVCAFADRKLRENAAAAGRIRRRHAEYYVDLAGQACAATTGEGHALWLSRLESEHQNLLVALQSSCLDGPDRSLAARLAMALQDFWTVRAYHSEGRTWLDRIVTERREVRDELQIRLLNALGTVAARQGDTAAAMRHYRRGIELAGELGDMPRLAGISSNLGWLLLEETDVDGAIDLQMKALRTYEALGDRPGVARVQLHLGDAWLHRSTSEARRLLEACLVAFRECGDIQRIAAAQRNLGEVAYREGNMAEAAARLREALELSRTLGDKEVTAEALLWIGKVWASRAQPARATSLYAASDAMLRVGGIRWTRAFSRAFDDSVEAARRSMDGPCFARDWSRGQAATPEQAIAWALGGL